MNPDNNWKETRLLAEDISTLLGVPAKTVEDFLLVLENLIVHRLAETISQEDFNGKDCSVELPYLGSLVVSCDDKGKVSTDFVVRPALYRKIRAVVNHSSTSPLIKQLCEILGEDCVRKMEEGTLSNE